MKKKLFTPIALIFTSLLFTIGCQKSTTEPPEEIVSINSLNSNTTNQCQLTHIIIDGFDNRFHYNAKGLADEWRIDYGDGVPDVYTMAYNSNNQLSRAWWHYDGDLIAKIDFVWTGNLITTEHWD